MEVEPKCCSLMALCCPCDYLYTRPTPSQHPQACPCVCHEIPHWQALKQAATDFAMFTGHNPYCQLIYDREQCSEDGEPPCPGDDTHGPCDCGYETLAKILGLPIDNSL